MVNITTPGGAGDQGSGSSNNVSKFIKEELYLRFAKIREE